MSFNLFFAGSSVRYVDEHIRDLGANRLFTWMFEKGTGKRFSEFFEEDDTLESKLFVDSSAYSAHTKDIEVDIDDYIDYLNALDKYTFCFAELDKIPGKYHKPKTKLQLLQAPETSWQNYLYMRERVLSPDKLLPIFHQGEDFKHLHRMLDQTFEGGKHIPYIGISPANDVHTKLKSVWAEQVFRIIRDSKNPNVKTHAFGMTALQQLELHPYYSADSTSPVLNAGMGGIMISQKYGGGTIQISKESGAVDEVYSKGKLYVDSLEAMLNEYGFTIEEVADSYRNRIKYNLTMCWDWAQRFEFQGIKQKQKRLF